MAHTYSINAEYFSSIYDYVKLLGRQCPSAKNLYVGCVDANEIDKKVLLPHTKSFYAIHLYLYKDTIDRIRFESPGDISSNYHNNYDKWYFILFKKELLSVEQINRINHFNFFEALQTNEFQIGQYAEIQCRVMQLINILCDVFTKYPNNYTLATDLIMAIMQYAQDQFFDYQIHLFNTSEQKLRCLIDKVYHRPFTNDEVTQLATGTLGILLKDINNGSSLDIQAQIFGRKCTEIKNVLSNTNLGLADIAKVFNFKDVDELSLFFIQQTGTDIEVYRRDSSL